MLELRLDELRERINEGKSFNLAEEISENGSILIGTSRVLTAKDIDRLEGKFFKIKVVTAQKPAVSPEETESFRLEIINLLNSHKDYKGLSDDKLKRVESIVTNIIPTNDQVVLIMMNMKKLAPKIFQHSIHVALKALIIDYAHQRRHNQGLIDGLKSELLLYAGLLHDVGMLKSASKFAKGKRMDSIDDSDYKEHPKVGYDFLKKSQSVNKLSNEVLNAILQHEERLDGSGFPNGTKGDYIAPLSQFIGICDEVDYYMHGELTSDIRPFDQIMRRLMTKTSQFDKKLINIVYEEFKHLSK